MDNRTKQSETQVKSEETIPTKRQVKNDIYNAEVIATRLAKPLQTTL